MIVRNTKQTLLASSEIERTQGGEGAAEGCFFIFFASLFFAEILKTDNMNTEDLLQQNTTHTFFERTGVFR
jgi:hypothetical protein